MAQTAATLGTSAPDPTQERAVSDTRRSGETNGQGERLICRNVQLQSYSRMGGHRVCHTPREWREIDRQEGE